MMVLNNSLRRNLIWFNYKCRESYLSDGAIKAIGTSTSLLTYFLVLLHSLPTETCVRLTYLPTLSRISTYKCRESCLSDGAIKALGTSTCLRTYTNIPTNYFAVRLTYLRTFFVSPYVLIRSRYRTTSRGRAECLHT